jgi:pyruvate dehydrogenase E2 component (dihydrolipoamide acetyltransferase)
MADLSSRACDSTLTPADVAGGTFTLADVGSVGGTGFTPIIEGPQVAILGIARPQSRLIERLGTVITRQMLPLALSYDHRVIDGTAAARFLAWLGGVVADLRRAAL